MEHGLNRSGQVAYEALPKSPDFKSEDKNRNETNESTPQPTNAAPVPAMALPQPVADDSSSNKPTADQQAGGMPVIASDDDVIEREWVQKAKQIVDQTKADPYEQEKEVSKLQADYLKKRYGKEIKAVSK